MTTHSRTTHAARRVRSAGQRGRAAAPELRLHPLRPQALVDHGALLRLLPAMIVLCLAGPVYQNDKGKATEWTKTQRYQAAIGGALFMAIGLARLFAMPAS